MACRCFSSSMIRECRHHCQPKHNAISSGYATLSGGCVLAAVVFWLPSGPIGTLVKCMLMQAWHALFSLLYHKNSCVANRKRRFVKQTKRICLPKISLLFSVQIRFVWFSFIKIPFVLISVCFLCLYQQLPSRPLLSMQYSVSSPGLHSPLGAGRVTGMPLASFALSEKSHAHLTSDLYFRSLLLRRNRPGFCRLSQRRQFCCGCIRGFCALLAFTL